LLIIPLAYLLLLYVSQWWLVQFADGQKVILYGFPLAYTTSGHGQLPATELYLMEFVFDYAFYVAALYLLYRLFQRYLEDMVVPRMLTAGLWVWVSVQALYYTWTILIPGRLNIYSRLPFVVAHMLKKGFAFCWQEY